MSSLSPQLSAILENYRQTIRWKNLTSLQFALAELETSVSKSNKSTAEAHEAVIRTLEVRFLNHSLPSNVVYDVRGDILNSPNYDILAKACRLEGVVYDNIDLPKREQWLAAVKEMLETIRPESREGWEWPDDLPAEFKELITNVHTIVGPGLPYSLVRGGTPFFSEEGLGSENDVRNGKGSSSRSRTLA
jgi:hypothetical protein